MKMQPYLVYDPQTGRALSSGICQDSLVSLQGDNVILLDEIYAVDKVYVVNGKVEPLPEKPDEFHAFDYSVKEWVLDTVALGDDVKLRRNLALADTDWTQLPDVPESTRIAYQTYRQALRDIPQQAGFPTDINWPTKPE